MRQWPRGGWTIASGEIQSWLAGASEPAGAASHAVRLVRERQAGVLRDTDGHLYFTADRVAAAIRQVGGGDPGFITAVTEALARLGAGGDEERADG